MLPSWPQDIDPCPSTCDDTCERSQADHAVGYCNHVFVRNTAVLGTAGPVWWVRYHVRHTTALRAAHTTAVAVTDAASTAPRCPG